jgi:hypothetical protein
VSGSVLSAHADLDLDTIWDYYAANASLCSSMTVRRSSFSNSKVESARRLEPLSGQPPSAIAAEKGHETANVVRFP